MTDNQETFVHPEGASDGATKLTVASEGLYSKFSRLSSKISGLNESSPWGTDQPGKEFNKNYLESSGDGGAPAATTLDAGKNLIDRVRQLGPDVHDAVAGTVEIDDLVKKWFGGDGK
jgi:hypothetical protein